MLIRWKFEKFAKIAAKICSLAIFVGMGVAFTISFYAYDAMYRQGWKSYAVSIIYPLCALCVGYVFPWLLGRDHKQCRTIAFETGVQNGILALTLINVQAVRGLGSAIALMTIPVLYTTFGFVETLALVALYWIARKCKKTSLGGERPCQLREKDIWAGKLAYINPMLSPRGQYVDRSIQTEINLWGNPEDKIITARKT
ncbi:ileal sodium/bile acid cotransporter-like [Saccoglossus kowalevskii]